MNIQCNILMLSLFFTITTFCSMPQLKKRHGGTRPIVIPTPNIDTITKDVINQHNAKNIDSPWQEIQPRRFKKENFELIVRTIEPNLQIMEIIAKESNTECKRVIIDSKDLRKELNTFLVDLIP